VICDLSDLPVEQCGCRVHAPAEKRPTRPERDASPWAIRARFPGVCPECEGRIVAGDLIVQVGADGAYVHEECADRA
jgi:hypothetical protein